MPKKFIGTGNTNSIKQSSKPSWITIFMARSGGISSKRLLGVVGFFICLGLLLAAFILEKEVPTFADMVLVASTSLVGVDAFRGIFSRNVGE